MVRRAGGRLSGGLLSAGLVDGVGREVQWASALQEERGVVNKDGHGDFFAWCQRVEGTRGAIPRHGRRPACVQEPWVADGGEGVVVAGAATVGEVDRRCSSAAVGHLLGGVHVEEER